MEIIKTIVLVCVTIKVLYILIGISYEWATHKEIKGFTLNLLASGLLFVLYFKSPDQDTSSTYAVTYNVKASGVWST